MTAAVVANAVFGVTGKFADNFLRVWRYGSLGNLGDGF
jgi:hypothetical protein